MGDISLSLSLALSLSVLNSGVSEIPTFSPLLLVFIFVVLPFILDAARLPNSDDLKGENEEEEEEGEEGEEEEEEGVKEEEEEEEEEGVQAVFLLDRTVSVATMRQSNGPFKY